MTQQKMPLGETTQRAEEREFGPGWKDVHFMLGEMGEATEVEARWRVTPLKSPEGRWGIRVTVYGSHDGTVTQGVGCYGSIFPGNGQKTLAAAMWRAIHNWTHNPTPIGESDRWFLAGLTNSEDDLPF